MKAKLLSLLPLMVCATALAQDKPRIVTWHVGDPGCTVFFSDGKPHERLIDAQRQLDIYLPTLRDKHTYTIMLGMVNLGTVPLDVDPANMGGLGSEAPSVVMKSVDGDALLMKENRHAHRWAILGAALSGAAAGASTSTATVENSDGSTSNVTYHDPNATRAANADARANRDAIDGRTARVASTVLRHNTLGPGEFVVGFVYVERPKGMGKKDGMGQFVVDLGDTIYIFPFEQGRIPR